MSADCYAVEFNPIRPTRSFARAAVAAEAAADRRQAPVALYLNGRVELIVHPAEQAPFQPVHTPRRSRCPQW